MPVPPVVNSASSGWAQITITLFSLFFIPSAFMFIAISPKIRINIKWLVFFISCMLLIMFIKAALRVKAIQFPHPAYVTFVENPSKAPAVPLQL